MNSVTGYTRVRFQIMAKYKVSVFQYCLLDCIFHCSTPYNWCSVNRGKIAEFLSCSYPSIIKAFSSLKEKGLIIESGHKFKVSALIHEALGSEIQNEIYSTIYPFRRKELKISFNEYCLIDSIYILSRKKSFYASKLYFAKLLGVTERAVFKMLHRAKEQGIIVILKKTKDSVHYVVSEKYKQIFSHDKNANQDQ